MTLTEESRTAVWAHFETPLLIGRISLTTCDYDSI